MIVVELAVLQNQFQYHLRVWPNHRRLLELGEDGKGGALYADIKQHMHVTSNGGLLSTMHLLSCNGSCYYVRAQSDKWTNTAAAVINMHELLVVCMPEN